MFEIKYYAHEDCFLLINFRKIETLILDEKIQTFYVLLK